jgi:predicted AlkP superfamily pyrophosphatase or phosphodiesterase
MNKLSLLLAAAFAVPVTAAPPQPKLIVAISVDQFSAELYNRYRAGFTGGLKTIGSGIAYPVGYQSHAATETCPGHSTILTGRHPSGTGIVANSWFDKKTGSNVYCVSAGLSADPQARGPQNLRATTLGDWMKKAAPADRVFAVSGKDRAAITMAGHMSNGTYWWADKEGFRTSPFAGAAGPEVTQPAKAFDAKLFADWAAKAPVIWPAPSAACAALQKPYRFGKADISGKVPPDATLHVEDAPNFAAAAEFQDQLRASPLFDKLIFAFATQVLDQNQLGKGPGTDLLAVSLSATDYVGHRYGNGGAEMCVQMAALDEGLGRFVEHLKGLGVPFVVVLTADHGSTDAAEREHDHDPQASRLDGGALVADLNKALKQQLDLAYDPIESGDPQQIYINVGPDAALATKVQDAAVAWLKARPEVREVYTRAQVEAATVAPGTPADKLTIAQRFNESYDPERSGDIAVAFSPRTSFGIPRGPTDYVAGHGSPWDHDRQVPILFWWPGAPGESRAAPAETVDIAPTLAALVKVPTPKVDGTCLELVSGGDSCPAK